MASLVLFNTSTILDSWTIRKCAWWFFSMLHVVVIMRSHCHLEEWHLWAAHFSCFSVFCFGNLVVIGAHSKDSSRCVWKSKATTNTSLHCKSRVATSWSNLVCRHMWVTYMAFLITIFWHAIACTWAWFAIMVNCECWMVAVRICSYLSHACIQYLVIGSLTLTNTEELLFVFEHLACPDLLVWRTTSSLWVINLTEGQVFTSGCFNTFEWCVSVLVSSIKLIDDNCSRYFVI